MRHDMVENPIESDGLATPSDEINFCCLKANLETNATLKQTQGYSNNTKRIDWSKPL